MIQFKRISFVWSQLSKYCILDAHHTVICGYRVRSQCTLIDGELPDTCVSGCGQYVCKYGEDATFELLLAYLEIDEVDGDIYVTGIIDIPRSLPELPLGLLTA